MPRKKQPAKPKKVARVRKSRRSPDEWGQEIGDILRHCKPEDFPPDDHWRYIYWHLGGRELKIGGAADKKIEAAVRRAI